MTHRIHFPSIHGAAGKPFVAEVDAPSAAHAVRTALEHCAAEGIALEYLQITNIDDLKGARLDGLKLSECRLQSVNLCGASLKGSRIGHTRFYKVVADSETKLDRAFLDNVHFDECALNGMSMRGANCSALRFEFTEARGLDLENASINGLRSPASDLRGWKAHMCCLKSVEAIEGLIDSMDLTQNQKGAVRTLAINGSREVAEKFLADLEALAG